MDVYRKSKQSARTFTATQTFTTTLTSSTLGTTTFTLAYGELSWSLRRRRHGCTTRSISGMQCVYSNGGYYEGCKVTGPKGAMVTIAENENAGRRRSSARRRFSLNGWRVNVKSLSRFRITPQHPWFDRSGQGRLVLKSWKPRRSTWICFQYVAIYFHGVALNFTSSRTISS